MCNRNTEIDLFRFVFASIILLMHFNAIWSVGLFPYGDIGVEFFFIVSGYFMTSSAMRLNSDEIGKDTIRYIFNRAKKIFPYYAVGAIIQVFLRYIFVDGYSLKQLISLLSRMLFEISFIFIGVGKHSNFYVTGNWYLSAMILASLILYPVILKNKNDALFIYLPVLSLLIIGAIESQFGFYVMLWDMNMWIFKSGLLRGIAEMSLGGISYGLVEYIKKIELTGLQKVSVTAIKYLSYVLVIVYALGLTSRDFDIYAVFYSFIAVTLTLAGDIGLVSIRSNRICYFLGKLSLPLYTVHGAICWIMYDMFGKNISRIHVLFGIIICYISAFTVMVVLENMVRRKK